MEASWKLGTFRGIPVGLHWSMALVFALLTLSLATSFFPDSREGLPVIAYWVMAIVCAVLFFTSILLHELGHSIVAIRHGIPVNGITLFIFGGVAQIGGRPTSATVELKVAAAGPVVSFILAGIFFLVGWVSGDIAWLSLPATWLGTLNLTLGVFNLLPGFPLDGGRILRALVWKFTDSEDRAAQVALVSGQILAFGMMGLGGYLAFTGNISNGLWLIFLGWFLQNAAVSEAQGSRVEIALRGVTVQQAMGPREPFIPSRMKLSQLVEEYVLDRGESYFVVVDDDIPRGVVTLADLGKVPRERLEWESAANVMTPWQRLHIVSPSTPLLDATEMMDDARVSSLPVMEGDRICGLLTREEVLHYIRLRMRVQPRAQ